MTQQQWAAEAGEEQRYYWERGFFAINRRPTYCDRGQFQVFLEATSVDDRGWSRYFFSEENAKEEVALWLEHWQQLQSSVYERPYPEPTLGDVCWSTEGKDCTVSLATITNAVAPGQFLGSVAVQADRETAFTVDYADLFPRFYFSQEVAIGELTAWMVCRKQVLMK